MCLPAFICSPVCLGLFAFPFLICLRASMARDQQTRRCLRKTAAVPSQGGRRDDHDVAGRRMAGPAAVTVVHRQPPPPPPGELNQLRRRTALLAPPRPGPGHDSGRRRGRLGHAAVATHRNPGRPAAQRWMSLAASVRGREARRRCKRGRRLGHADGWRRRGRVDAQAG